MTKNFLQDIVPPKRSIRNVPLPTSRRKKVKSEILTEDYDVEDIAVQEVIPPTMPPVVPPRSDKTDFNDLYKKRFSWKRNAVVFGSLAVIVLIAVFALSAFSGATLTILPKQESVEIDEILQVYNMDFINDDSQLTYKVITLSDEVSAEVPATGEEKVQAKASGIITISNNYSEKTQALVKNTRFEDKDGLIYRIDKSIVVPGYKKSGDKVTPGTIDVEVFADVIGEKYNKDSAEFTIPGFKGQPQFERFSAKTKTALSGGFDGIKKIVSEKDLNEASYNLETKIKDNLKGLLEKEKNDETMVLFDDRLFSIGKIQQKESKGDSVLLGLTGSLNLVVFNKDKFNNKVANETLTVFKNDDKVTLLDESALSVKITTESDLSQDIKEMALSVSGAVTFVWQTDHELLKQKILGQSKKELKSILQEFSSLAKAEATINPFWSSTFPEDINKIKIIQEKI